MATDLDDLNDVRLLRIGEVLSLFPVGRSTWWAGVKTGKFPAPVKLSPKCTAWRAADIRELVQRLAHDAEEERHVD